MWLSVGGSARNIHTVQAYRYHLRILTTQVSFPRSQGTLTAAAKTIGGARVDVSE